MSPFLKIGEVDIADLLGELEGNPQLWGQYGLRKSGVHQEMTDIWVRYNDIENLDPSNPSAFNEPFIPVWYPAWNVLFSLREILFWLMWRVQGEMLGGVLITRIPPKAGIAPHKDKSWHVDYFDKFYVSVQSQPGAVFVDVDSGEALQPKAGEVWRYDNRRVHAVENKSDKDRITLIACIRTEMFSGNAF